MIVNSEQQAVNSRRTESISCSLLAARCSLRAKRGFTLIEMLVVLGIMALISGLMFANYNQFGGQVQVQNLAYDIALTLRQAQIYGIAVKRFDGTNAYANGYGVHFDLADKKQFIMFADINPANGNGVYDSAANELVSGPAINQGFGIYDLCAMDPGSSNETCGLSSLNITFRRPESDAYILKNGDALTFDADGGITSADLREEEARIVVSSPRGDLRSVVVWSNGQITVESGGSPSK